jgi:hypothetical protein
VQLILQKINRLIRQIYIHPPRKYRIIFEEKLISENLVRLRMLAYIICSIAPFGIFAHFKIYTQGFCGRTPGYCEFLFTTHYVAYLISGIYIFLYPKIILPSFGKRSAHIISLIFILIYFLLFSSSSLASQFFSGNIVFFTMGVVLLSSLLVSFKKETTYLYIFILIFFLIGLKLLQRDPDILLVNVLNSILAMIIAYALNLVLYHYKLSDFLITKKIELKTVELNSTIKDIKKDIATAKKIQLNLIPKIFKTELALKFELAYIPLDDIGGDIYDVSEINKKMIRIFLADATGHGVQAALITMVIKAEYESLKYQTRTPKKLLKYLNESFFTKFGSLNTFFSCVLVDIYPEKNRIIYSSAGHPDQLIQRKSWDFEMLRRTGKLIGIHKDSEYEEQEVGFEKGDKLFLFTDGIFEEFNSEKEEFGEERIVSILKAHSDKELKELFPNILADLEEFLETKRKQDDISFIGIEHT